MISQTEYDCPAQEDARQRVLQWIAVGAVVSLLILIIAFGIVMFA